LLAAVPGVTPPVFAEESASTDVFLVDRNIFEIDPHTIDDTKVVITIVEGKLAYEADAK
jgi:predicted amidohydrolase YtcJ